jgi:hypothetical protein
VDSSAGWVALALPKVERLWLCPAAPYRIKHALMI